MADIVRIGRVSSVNYETGMVTVAYQDKSDKVTPEMPCLGFGEYNTPSVGEFVAVVHSPNGSGNDICLGTINNESQMPDVSGKGNFYKKLGTAHMQTEGGSLSFHDDSGSISIEDILEMKKRILELESRIGG